MADAIIVALVLLIAGGASAWMLVPRMRWEIPRVVRGNDYTDEKLRRAAIRAANTAQVEGLPREQAQAVIEEEVRHAVAREYSAIYPGVPVAVTENWPGATCIITENIAVIEIWVGHTHDGEGIRPVRAEVRRSVPLKLDTRRPIRDALADSHVLPPRDASAGPQKARRRPTMR